MLFRSRAEHTAVCAVPRHDRFALVGDSDGCGKRADARDCSTGEQKALLISIVLANARLQTQRRDGLTPLLLLDEIAAHLDEQRRAALFDELLALNAQAWLTGTDRSLFTPLEARAQFFAIQAGQFAAQERP